MKTASTLLSALSICLLPLSQAHSDGPSNNLVNIGGMYQLKKQEIPLGAANCPKELSVQLISSPEKRDVYLACFPNKEDCEIAPLPGPASLYNVLAFVSIDRPQITFKPFFNYGGLVPELTIRSYVSGLELVREALSIDNDGALRYQDKTTMKLSNKSNTLTWSQTVKLPTNAEVKAAKCTYARVN